MTDSTDNFAKLIIDDKEHEFPIYKATIGQDVIDISSLYSKTGYFTYDSGFKSTASCRSSITYIDGDAGKLSHRGYDIEELTEKCDFEEVCHLLLYGDLPNKEQKLKFADSLESSYMIHDQLQQLFKGFKRDSHPMAILVGAVGSLSAFYHDDLDIRDSNQRERAIIKILAKVMTLACMAYKYTRGDTFIPPKSGYSHVQNMLHMMFSTPMKEYKQNDAIVAALNKIFILHADHEQNASTSAVRMVGSSGANPFAAIAAGIASLWGPAHGGANEAVILMLEEIGTVERIPHFIERAKNPDDPFRLMGFGHRVYKNYDPRARVLKSSYDEVVAQLGKDHPLIGVAKTLEEIALNDEYFIQKKLFPNVDFYSGLIYLLLGIPTRMFTVMFAIARTAGWISQWKEMIEDPETKISRPRQLYTGEVDRKIKRRK